MDNKKLNGSWTKETATREEAKHKILADFIRNSWNKRDVATAARESKPRS